MRIAMPGHYNEYMNEEGVLERETDRLQKLISEHDVVYLLTDNRESRWLPTVIGQIEQKIVISVALGFDSYSIVRHGLSQ